MTYTINYHTGAGDITADYPSLDDAMREADEGIAYTQAPVTIEDGHGTVLATRMWYGTTDGFEDDEDAVCFGDFGCYTGWRIER